MKKPKKIHPVALPPGVTKYTGSTKGLKRFLQEPAALASGGCRTVHGQGATQTSR